MPADGAVDIAIENRSDQAAQLESLVFETAPAP
jgi:hypothetical protein